MVKKEENTPRIKEIKYRARQYSIKEGIFASAKSSLGAYFLRPFAIAINASNSLVAMLTSISGLLGPASQLFSSRLMEKYSRKKIILNAVFLEALAWIPFIAIAFLFYDGISTGILPIIFMIVFSFYIISFNIITPALFSWMGDLINERYRGRWFSKRNLIVGFVSAVLAISGSVFLDFFKDVNLMIGFVILFSLALISRAMCWRIYRKQFEPKMKLRKGYYFSFFNFIINAPKNNFGRFAIFRGILGFSTAIASSLLTVYLLRFLDFNYTTYMIIIFSGTIFSLLIMYVWGRIADQFGNYRVLYITTALIPLVPILWVLSPSPIYLILVPSLIGGVSWAGFRLAASNFIYDNVRQQKRGLAISYFNMLNGIGIFFGAGLGALMIEFLDLSFVEPIIAIFFLSGIVRMLSVFIFMPLIKEVRKTNIPKRKSFFRDVVFRNLGPALTEEAHQIMSIKNYLTKR